MLIFRDGKLHSCHPEKGHPPETFRRMYLKGHLLFYYFLLFIIVSLTLFVVVDSLSLTMLQLIVVEFDI